MTTPLSDDPNAKLAALLARSAAGKPLAVYGSVRSTHRVPDALVGLGLPLIAYVLDAVADEPVRVTAVHQHHSAGNPVLGLGTDVDLWTVLVRCASGMTITIDVGAGPWTTGASPLELRIEWMTSEQVTVFHPRGASIDSSEPGDRSLGLTGIEERLLSYAEELCDRVEDDDLPPELTGAMRIVEAARDSASVATPVDVSRPLRQLRRLTGG